MKHTQHIGIDPGRTTGWASFEQKKLICAGYCKQEKFYDGVCSALIDCTIFIEKPRWYPDKRKIDVNDLLDLSIFVGELKKSFEGIGEVRLITPHEWKGSVRKDIHNRRVLKALTPNELELLPLRPRAKDYDHNMLDAVGIGLWSVGRL